MGDGAVELVVLGVAQDGGVYGSEGTLEVQSHVLTTFVAVAVLQHLRVTCLWHAASPRSP